MPASWRSFGIDGLDELHELGRLRDDGARLLGARRGARARRRRADGERGSERRTSVRFMFGRGINCRARTGPRTTYVPPATGLPQAMRGLEAPVLARPRRRRRRARARCPASTSTCATSPVSLDGEPQLELALDAVLLRLRIDAVVDLGLERRARASSAPRCTARRRRPPPSCACRRASEIAEATFGAAAAGGGASARPCRPMPGPTSRPPPPPALPIARFIATGAACAACATARPTGAGAAAGLGAAGFAMGLGGGGRLGLRRLLLLRVLDGDRDRAPADLALLRDGDEPRRQRHVQRARR